MLDIAKATEVLENYFENVTQEQFALDLRRFCPELFEPEEENLKSEKLKIAEIHQHSREDSKIKIAHKLLLKGCV